MMKVVFISHDPITISIREQFMIDEFLNNGCSIQYWCIRKLTDYSDNIRVVDQHTPSYYKEVESLKELEMLIKEQSSNVMYCVELWFNRKTAPIYNLLSPLSKRVFTIDWYANTAKLPLAERLKEDLKHMRFSKIGKLITAKVNSKITHFLTRKISRPSLVFCPGGNSVNLYNNCEIIPIHHYDYSKYIKGLFLAQETTIDGEYAVFLDNMMPHHPDFKRIGQKTVDYDTYFEKMNKLFVYVEQNWGLKVVIAAHPKSDYRSEFGNRDVVKYKTDALVKGSSLILAHSSASLNFAILNKKPLLFVITDDFFQVGKKYVALSNIKNTIQLYHRILEAGIVNIDELASLKFPEVNKGKYTDYINNYIKGKDDRSNFEIIYDVISKRCNSI